MQPLGASYEEKLDVLLGILRLKADGARLATSRFVSSVNNTGGTKESVDVRYWRKNLESPVMFSQAVTSIAETTDILIEIGPHAALRGPIRQIASSLTSTKFPEYIPTLIRSVDGTICLLRTAGNLFSKGYAIDLGQVNSLSTLDDTTNTISITQTGKPIVDLPHYQWQYNDLLYFENRWTREWRLRSHPRHDILGSCSPGGTINEPMWRNVITQKDLPWLQDHFHLV